MKIDLFTKLAKLQETIDALDSDLWREDWRGWKYSEECNCNRCRWLRNLK